MTCLRCNDTGYLRDRTWCSCGARPFDAGGELEQRLWSDETLKFLLRLRDQSMPGSNAEPEDHTDPEPILELDEPAEPMSKADALIERAKRMGRSA
jgi:hypothetical protein